MKRSPLPRSTKPPKKRRSGKPRRVSVVRDKGYREWLTTQRCVACVARPRGFPERIWVDPAHTLNNGRSSKGGDDSCIPLCRHHHDEMDGRLNTKIVTKAAFAEKYGLDLAAIASEHYSHYLQEKKR